MMMMMIHWDAASST